MSAITDAVAVCKALAGKDLTNPQLLSIVDRYLASFGSLWSNPHDPEADPDAYNAWPTNEEKAQGFLDFMRQEARSRLYRRGKEEAEATQDAAIKAAAAAAADEL